MPTARTCRSLLMTSALVGAMLASWPSAMPIARADDPLAPIITAVILSRSQTECPRLTYNPVLEAAAQKYARTEVFLDGVPPRYNGNTGPVLGSGDPQNAAINNALSRGARAMIEDCNNNEFGVGFIRHEDRSVDVVTIVFGSPSNQVFGEPMSPPVATPVPAPVQCPAGSPTPTVPVGGTCAEVPPPKDSVDVSFDKGIQWTVNVTSSADIVGKCTYSAKNPVLPGSNKDFDIGARGSVTFTVLAPPPFSTYHVVVSCSGPFNGKTVEFGHVERDVSA